MNQFQKDVLAFHQATGMPSGQGPFSRPKLRSSLILEEALETIRALGYEVVLDTEWEGVGLNFVLEQVDTVDTVSTIDGICDLIYVALGAAMELGIDIEPYWNEVHRSNMAKVGGGQREDGKRLKPAGWTPPDLYSIFKRLGTQNLAALSGAVEE